MAHEDSTTYSSGDRSAPGRSRLHWVYFLLAGFDLLTVGLSLFILTRVGDIYTESVRVNQRWAQRLGDYRELMTLASAVNAPGNDLFTSRDADRESIRLEAAVPLFQQKLQDVRQDLNANVSEVDRSELLEVLDAIDQANEQMLGETRSLLSAFRDGQLDQAGKWMASMDHSHAKVHAALVDLGERVSAIQKVQFEKQTAQAALLERLEIVVIGLIIAMVVGITVYGWKLAQRMTASENQIRQLNAELEDRVHDRTAELSAANKTLFEREQRLHAIFDTAFCAIVTFDEQGVVESYNQAGQRVFGYRADEVVGQNIQLLIAEETPRDVAMDLIKLSSTTKQASQAQEMAGVRKDGTTFPMSLSMTQVELPDRKLYTGIINDLTDEKRALQAERLASIGQMITAITHESRNALQRIQAGLDILQFEVQDGSEAKDDLEKITSATDDLSQLFDEIRSYAAPIKLEPFTCDLADLWRKAWTNMASTRKGPQASLYEEINGVNLVCTMDAFRIEQVFRNLIENSLSACPNPVEIAIQCEDVRLNDAPAVCVSVRDNGPGLTDEQKKRIFEAFFTTKAKGTGLGMAIALRIVEAHRGTILAGNGHRGGAEFLITLPRNKS